MPLSFADKLPSASDVWLPVELPPSLAGGSQIDNPNHIGFSQKLSPNNWAKAPALRLLHFILQLKLEAIQSKGNSVRILCSLSQQHHHTSNSKIIALIFIKKEIDINIANE